MPMSSLRFSTPSKTDLAVSVDQTYDFINLAQVNNINFPVDDPAAQASYEKLSNNLKIWLWFEQKNNDKLFDSDFFPKMDDTRLHARYLPENRNLITLIAYKIPDSMLDKLYLDSSEFIQRFVDQPGYSTLLIHPSLFDGANGARNKQLLSQLGCTISSRRFYFMPAASARTGLTWELGREAQPFFTKMSVQPESITGGLAQKTDLSPEGKISVAKTAALISSASTIKDSFFMMNIAWN